MDSGLIDAAWNKEEIKNWASRFLGLYAAEILYDKEVTGAYLLTRVFDEDDLKAPPFHFNDMIASNVMTYINGSKSPQLTLQKLMNAVTRATLTVEQMTLMRDWLSGLLEGRIISHEDSRFDFPIPVGITPVGWTSLPELPFFNRQSTLLTLLNDCYANFLLEGTITKPIAAFIATSPGFGKTRLLLEWAIRVFHDTRVLNAFWNGKSEASPKDHAPPFAPLIGDIRQWTTKTQDKDKHKRARFIGSLHRTLKQSSIISASANILNPVHIADPNDVQQVAHVVDVICRKIMGHALCERFCGKRIEYANKSVEIPKAFDASLDIDKEWLSKMGLLSSEGVFFSLFRLFMAGIDLEHKSFSHFGDGQSPRMVLVNIDESQSLVRVAAHGKALAYYVLQKFYSLSGKKIDGYEIRIHVLMVSLLSTGLDTLQDRTTLYTRIALPLGPLLSKSYCDTLCQYITQQPLDDNAQSFIRVLWKKCMGIPRAIRILHYALDENKTKLVSGNPDAKKNVLLRFRDLVGRSCFSPTGLNKSSAMVNYGLTSVAWERMVVESSLCVPKKQTDVIGTTTYSALELEVTLVPIKFGTNEKHEEVRHYTMPFHFYEQIELPNINLLKSDPPDALHAQMLQRYTPCIEDIVGPEDSTINLQIHLTRAAAVSVWARFKLNRSPADWHQLTDVIHTWPFQHHYCRFDSVTRAKVPLGREQLNLLKESRSIIINDAFEDFANVLIPILNLPTPELFQQHKQLTEDSNKSIPRTRHGVQVIDQAQKKLCQFELDNTAFLLVHCSNDVLIEDQLNLMNDGHVIVLIAPTASLSSLEQQTKELNTKYPQYSGQWIATTGHGWLSELFLGPLRDENDALEEMEESHEAVELPDNSDASIQPTGRKRKLEVQEGGQTKKAKVTADK